MCKCSTTGCKAQALPHRKICGKCKSRRYRKAHQLEACFMALRDNAKRRGKAFTLTLDQFKAFATATNYIAGKGRTKTSYSIDRIDNNQGYTIDNIRVLTVGENSRKGAKVLHFDWQTKTAFVEDTRKRIVNYDPIF